MGDLISNLSLGFGIALSLKNIGLCFLGCLVGTLIGVLPGVGPIATIAMLLPITFGLDPVGALIMLAGIYYGAQYGGSTTAILVNIPGEATSVVTTLDGHQMARQGRAGIALGISAIGSFFAGTVATLVIAALAVPLTRLAQVFGAAEYFSLMVMGLIFAVVTARGSILKALAMILVGLLLSTVGTDLDTGAARLTFGFERISDGIDFAVLAMGVFGFAEILRNLESPETRDVVRGKIGRLLPGREDLRQPRHRWRAAPCSARSSESCPATARCLDRSRPIRSKRRSPPTRPASGAAPSRAWRGRRRRTMPGRRPRSSRC